MKVGIIGAGQIGGALTRRLTTVGHEVFVANSREPSTLALLAAETGAHAVTAREAARAGEIVVVTIPLISVRDLPKDLFAEVSDGVAEHEGRVVGAAALDRARFLRPGHRAAALAAEVAEDDVEERAVHRLAHDIAEDRAR